MPRGGWTNRFQMLESDDQNAQLARLRHRGGILQAAVSNFVLAMDAASHGVQASFSIWTLQGISSFCLLRNTTRDPGTAKVVFNATRDTLITTPQTFPINETVTDADTAIAGQPVYYWIKIVPAADTEAPVFIGPQFLDLSADPGPPLAILDFAASHGAKSGNSIAIRAVVKPPVDPRYDSVRIYATGYQGSQGATPVAQNQATSFSFNLLQTGETITLQARSVSKAGQENGGGPTVNLTLSAAATVPAKVMNATALELGTSGVQLSWPTGPESDLTQYLVFRAAKGGGFGAASQIGTVNPTGASIYNFLDTAGLTGVFEWYVVAKNGIGQGTTSDAIVTPSLNTSADVPPNSTSNVSNNATVDSIDNGNSTDTIRVYGPGGVGASWTRFTGYGNETYPAGTLTPFSQGTKYYVLYDKLNQVFIVTANFPSVLPDYYIFAGVIKTVAAGNTGGSSGGGGGTGGSSGGDKYQEILNVS